MSDTMQPPADVRERVLTMLTAMEWAALIEHHDGRWYACCPWCGGENPDDDETPPGRAGHAERCELAAVIALLRASRGEGEAEAESGGDVTVSQLLAVLDEYNAEMFCMTPENADGTPMFSVAIARGESAERLKQWANEDAEESAALRSETQGEDDVGEVCHLCGEEFDPRETGTVTGPLGQDDGVPRWYRCPRCARAYDAGYQQGQRDPRGDEAHAARRGEGGGE